MNLGTALASLASTRMYPSLPQVTSPSAPAPWPTPPWATPPWATPLGPHRAIARTCLVLWLPPLEPVPRYGPPPQALLQPTVSVQRVPAEATATLTMAQSRNPALPGLQLRQDHRTTQSLPAL